MHRPSKLAFSAAALAALLVAGSTLAQIAQPFKPRPKIRLQQPLPLPTFGELGAPLAGLSSAQLALFNAGREEFQASETVEGGLGPIFNGNACAACHAAGALGGASAVTVTRFGRVVNGQFDPLDHLGGSLLQDKAIAPEALETVPPEANVVARRLSTPLFGAGLIEAISDAQILLGAERAQADGVRGRAALVTDVVSGSTRVGRFGWKAQQATLLAFAGDAYLNEMGVTNRYFPTENAPNGNQALLAVWDRVPELEDAVDPATGTSDIDHAADFMRLLAPPATLRATASSLAGAAVFERIRCSACHTPVLLTGASPVAALAFQTVPLYSDLLLHDMGQLGDGIEQGAAKMTEMRTAPLWGLRARGPYLHDGRASTVDGAIRAHDGQGAPARERYNALGAPERKQLLAFLLSI
jgi:CxxC motif-containing protein (DUF1111 family)